MSAELELAAWTLEGLKLWSTFVEPPWTYTVEKEMVQLDVMGNKMSFDIKKGPDTSTAANKPRDQIAGTGGASD